MLPYREAKGILGISHGPNRRNRGRHAADRPFKPLAVLLLVPVIAIAAILIAVVIVPPFAGLGLGVKRIDARLTSLGADFTRIPRFPERSTIYAADGTTGSPRSTSTTARSSASPTSARSRARRSWRSRTRSSTSTAR